MSNLLPSLQLRLVVFTAGFAVMGIEMSASRLLAPYFGTSLYVWAVLIGLIMVYLTVGYYLGGHLADRLPHPDVLYRLTALAGFAVGLIPLLAHPILQWSALGFAELSAGIFLGALAGVLALFAIPVIMLGCVSPFAVRLEASTLQRVGNAAGSMYALSTIGSLLGTFVAVFAFIPTIGTRRTLLIFSLLLMGASLVGLLRYQPRRLLYLALLAPAVVQLIFPAGPVRAANGGRLIYETESAYYYIQVVQQGSERELILDEGHAVHSVFDPHHLLTGEYWDDFLLAPLLRPGYRPGQVRQIAVLGLGGGTAVRLMAHVYPWAHIDGVEIDPRIVAVARRYFDLHERQLHTYTEDARYFLLTHPRHYDVVTIDAFRQPYIPFQLTTTNFFQLVRQRLTPHGVVAINCGHTATDYRLVDSIARTMRAVFPSVWVVDVPGTINSLVMAATGPTNPQVIRRNLASASRLSRVVAERVLGSGNLRPSPDRGMIFTDDLAPVEQLIDQIVLDYVKSS